MPHTVSMYPTIVIKIAQETHMSNAHIKIHNADEGVQFADELVDSLKGRTLAIEFPARVDTATPRRMVSIQDFGGKYIIDSPQMPMYRDRIFTPHVQALVARGDLQLTQLDTHTIHTKRSMAIMVLEVFGEGNEYAKVIGEYDIIP